MCMKVKIESYWFLSYNETFYVSKIIAYFILSQLFLNISLWLWVQLNTPSVFVGMQAISKKT